MNLFDDALFQSISQTFFDMAGIEVIPASQEKKESIQYSSVIAIKFVVPEHGQLQFFLPRICKQMIVENIYSESWKALSPRETDDCLLELVNVSAGSFLEKRFPGQIYKMNLPALYFDDSGLIEGKAYYFKAAGNLFMVSYGVFY